MYQEMVHLYLSNELYKPALLDCVVISQVIRLVRGQDEPER